ncbi:hypothetical protein [Nocardia vaccinii]|nr:hypothetical protein [Nocardia vaccinii]
MPTSLPSPPGETPVEHLVGADHVLPDSTDVQKLKQVMSGLVRSET